MKKICSLALLICFLSLNSSAQDKIYRKNGKVVQAKILEVGSSEIKYRVWKDDTGPVYILETDKIQKVEFENGKVEKFTPDLKDPELYADQLNKAIKVNFLGPLFGFMQISYEKSTGVGKGYEASLAIIGAGKTSTLDYYDNSLQTNRTNQFGFAASFGYKFNKLPDFLFGRTRLTHIMQGAYIKPVLYLGNYSENMVVYKQNYSSPSVERQNITFGALQLEFGKQWVFGDKIVFDMYGGFGYGADNKKSDYYYDYEDDAASNYLNLRAGTSPGFSVTGGLKLGLLIK